MDEKPMSLAVALDFAEEPRRHSTLQAPADTMEELYEALKVLAKAYQEAAPPWQLIDTARAKDGTRILGWDGQHQFTCHFRGEKHLPHQDKPGWFDQHIRMQPTHWKPLGPPPEQH